MPITRRKRVNPPEQPENNNQGNEQAEKAPEAPVVEQAPETAQSVEAQQSVSAPSAPPTPTPNGIAESAPAPYQPFISASSPVTPGINGERKEPGERPERITRHDYTPTIEGGRRTSRGELFRRPPQPPMPQPVNTMPPQQPALQAPSHEINLPLGNLLHLAYNPGYTGSDEARSQLLEKLSNESKEGGRARCWSCGSIAIVYDRWNTRSKTFGEVGIAFCEICGVWSVM
jgi:hypothetical protein